ncbi:MAG: heparinase II/III family protein, partial [Candidatus Eremiobacterota bacterium]
DGWEPRSSWILLRGVPQAAPLWTHDDLLSLCLTLDGEPLLVEPGAPAIGGSTYQVFASIASHSALRIAGEREPLRLSRETGPHEVAAEPRKQGIYLGASRDVWCHPEIPLRLTREVLFQPERKRLTVRDRLEGTGEALLESNLLLAPHLDLLMRGDMGCLIRGKRLQARIHPVFPGRFKYALHKGRTQPFAGWLWSESSRAVPTQRLCYHCRLSLPACTYLWIGWEPGDTAAPRAEDMDRLFE